MVRVLLSADEALRVADTDPEREAEADGDVEGDGLWVRDAVVVKEREGDPVAAGLREGLPVDVRDADGEAELLPVALPEAVTVRVWRVVTDSDGVCEGVALPDRGTVADGERDRDGLSDGLWRGLAVLLGVLVGGLWEREAIHVADGVRDGVAQGLRDSDVVGVAVVEGLAEGRLGVRVQETVLRLGVRLPLPGLSVTVRDGVSRGVGLRLGLRERDGVGV